ncbi:MAG: hypothetical protein IKN00_00270 [Bacteroidales bacterium]|nr:hypothetical protein [Bacteroidales bacterium]
MTKKHKTLIVLLTPFLLGFLLGILVGGACSKKEQPVAQETVVQEEILEPVQEQPEDPEPALEDDDVDGTGVSAAREVIYDVRRMAYATIFDDINDLHLEKAREIGLKSVPEKRDAIDTKLLVKVEESDYLSIDELRYSVPYLTAGAAAELNRIAKAFSDSLTRKQLPVYKLVCSSILRTEEDVARLRKSGNPNASDNSAHCYGTTFDITYTKYDRDEETDEFMQPFELTKVLGEVLRDEKNAGRILVKYERKEHCFHITSCQ